MDTGRRKQQVIIPCSYKDVNSLFQLPEQVPGNIGTKELSQLLEHVNQELRKTDLAHKVKRLERKRALFKIPAVMFLLILLICITTIGLKINDVIDDGVRGKVAGRHCLPPCPDGNPRFTRSPCGTACFKYRDGNNYYNGDFTCEFVGIFGMCPLLLITSVLWACCWPIGIRCGMLRERIMPILQEWNRAPSNSLQAEFVGPGCQHTERYFLCCCGGCCQCREEKTTCHSGYLRAVIKDDVLAV